MLLNISYKFSFIYVLEAFKHDQIERKVHANNNIFLFFSILQVMINTEWGALGNDGSLDFIMTDYDKQVDKHSINAGQQM